ncbi:hypothetical protein Hanom_Chr09g00804061 [Helianthus anomalus]
MFVLNNCYEIYLNLLKYLVLWNSLEQSERLVLAPRCFRHRLGCDNHRQHFCAILSFTFELICYFHPNVNFFLPKLSMNFEIFCHFHPNICYKINPNYTLG